MANDVIEPMTVGRDKNRPARGVRFDMNGHEMPAVLTSYPVFNGRRPCKY